MANSIHAKGKQLVYKEPRTFKLCHIELLLQLHLAIVHFKLLTHLIQCIALEVTALCGSKQASSFRVAWDEG